MAQERKDFYDLSENGQLGDWCFINTETYICLRYPDGTLAGDIIVLPISPDAHPKGSKAHWEWNGNKVSPTLSPSIGVGSPPYKWHGWLRDGKLVTA